MLNKSKIEQEPLAVEILTQQLRIRGVLHIHKGSRLTDFINAHKDFIPVTQAQVATLSDGRFLYEAAFMSLNWQHVVAILPTEVQAPAPPGPDPGVPERMDEGLGEERMP